MTVNLALEYIPRRMKELGYGNNYILRFRHFTLSPSEKRIITSLAGEFFLLVEENFYLRIESETGIYDLGAKNSNEMQYEHQGEIALINSDSENFIHTKFIQVIPIHNEPNCRTNKC